MGTMANVKDINAIVKVVACGASNGVAAGAGDNTAVPGASINRKPPGGVGYNTAALVYAFKSVQAGATTFSVQLEVQEADDNGSGAPGSFGTATVLQALTNTGAAGSSTTTGVVKISDPNFSSRKQWVRYNFTPDLSAGGADTFVGSLVLVMGGADALPAT